MYHRQEILISVTINDKSPLQVYEKGPHETEFKILFKKKKGNKQAKSLAKDTKKWWKYLLGNRTDQLFSTWRIIKMWLFHFLFTEKNKTTEVFFALLSNILINYCNCISLQLIIII